MQKSWTLQCHWEKLTEQVEMLLSMTRCWPIHYVHSTNQTVPSWLPVKGKWPPATAPKRGHFTQGYIDHLYGDKSVYQFFVRSVLYHYAYASEIIIVQLTSVSNVLLVVMIKMYIFNIFLCKTSVQSVPAVLIPATIVHETYLRTCIVEVVNSRAVSGLSDVGLFCL